MTGENRTFRLLGLHWAGADRAAVQKRPMTCWHSNGPTAAGRKCPASYATGQALVALHETGLPATSAAYR